MGKAANPPLDSLALAAQSLEGLSVGDAFGERYFLPDAEARELLRGRVIAGPGFSDTPWEYTDDTQMALSVVSVLRRFGYIDQQALAVSFAEHFDPSRGYGMGAFRLLLDLCIRDDWRSAAQAMFGGLGSFGNGAAMRVAPVGAYFSANFEETQKQAKRSAEVTHMHPEGIAGAIAVAIAAAVATRSRSQAPPSFEGFLNAVLAWVPESEVRCRLGRALSLGPDVSPELAASELGSGYEVSAQDTVPFAIWSSAAHLESYENALWSTLAGLGDRDTTCAITGGIVVMYTGLEGVPPEWLSAREALPVW